MEADIDGMLVNETKKICIHFKKVDPDFSAIETRYGSGYRWNVS